jgi:hypothetical protein
MDLETQKKVEKSIENLATKQAKIYFLVQDTKGNAKAGIRQIYNIALSLKNNGFNPQILHESKNYTSPTEWLGEGYEDLPHSAIESGDLRISPEDFVVIPEIFGHVLEQLSNIPSGKIILLQAYDHMLETLAPGASWSQYGFVKCLVTTEEQKEFTSKIMRNTSFDILEPFIPTLFSPKEKPAKPIITIHTREPRNTAKIIKTFYLKYPQFRWITFRDMRGLTQEEFASHLKESFVSIWVDDESGFGTFPLESMSSGTPVIGKVPNMKPSWMSDQNGIWTYDFNKIVDILAEFIQNWLEDNISDTLYSAGISTASNFQNQELFDIRVTSLFNSYLDTRRETFVEQLEKIKLEENTTDGK